MRKIKVAQIGINTYSHSNEIFASMRNQSDLFDVVGVVLPENEAERIPHKLEWMKPPKILTLDEVLNNPEIEAVTIETDEIYLTKYAILAAKAGKHIHMEKPGSLSLEDFEQLISIMKKTGKVFHTGYMYRYNPYVKEIVEKTKNGELGEIISVEAQMNCIHPKTTREWLGTLPGGMMFYLGCHLIDLVLLLQGKPKRIIPYNKSSGVDGVEAKDFCMAVFEYENAVSFVKTTSVELGGFERRQLVVNGTKATIELNPLEWYLPNSYSALQTTKITRTSTDWSKSGEREISAPLSRYNDMMKAFAEYVRGEKQNPYTLDYELELYKTILNVCEEAL